jgi:hypothetical protein
MIKKTRAIKSQQIQFQSKAGADCVHPRHRESTAWEPSLLANLDLLNLTI